MANVLDFTCDNIPADLIGDIFLRQHKLAEKYIPIEKNNGLCLYDQLPADLDDARAQARIKDMSWRAVEEVAEAFEALDLKEYTHFYEEMADALHFLVEKYLLCDFLPIGPEFAVKFFPIEAMKPTSQLGSFFYADYRYEPIDLPDGKDLFWKRRRALDIAMADFIKCCGLTCNCLKNKPWKQSQMLTDVPKFKLVLMNEFQSFINLCNTAGFTAESLYCMYVRKNKVNQFRQRSNY